MKTLLILRHAKSSWDEPGLPDHDRPLNPRGQRDAEQTRRAQQQQADSPRGGTAGYSIVRIDVMLPKKALQFDEGNSVGSASATSKVNVTTFA